MFSLLAAGTKGDMPKGPVLIVITIAVVAIIAAYFYVDHRLKRRAGEQLEAFAAEQGWEYDHKADGLQRRYIGFPFGGETAEADFAFRGQYRGRDFLSFQYTFYDRWLDGEEEKTKKHYFHVTGLLTPAPRPMLTAWPASGADRFFGKLGGKLGVEFQSANPEFNRRFHVETEDIGFARALIEPHLAAWMAAEPRFDQLPFRFERQDLVTWSEWSGSAGDDTAGGLNLDRWLGANRGNLFGFNPAKIEPENIIPTLDFLSDILDRVPDEVWQ